MLHYIRNYPYTRVVLQVTAPSHVVLGRQSCGCPGVHGRTAQEECADLPQLGRGIQTEAQRRGPKETFQRKEQNLN